MARDDGPSKRRGPGENKPGPRREPFTAGEIWRLIIGSYRASLPYLIVFIAGLLLATWLLTELLF